MSKIRAAIPDLLCEQFFFFFYYDGNKSLTVQIKALLMEVGIFSMDTVCFLMSEICMTSPGAVSVSAASEGSIMKVEVSRTVWHCSTSACPSLLDIQSTHRHCLHCS